MTINGHFSSYLEFRGFRFFFTRFLLKGHKFHFSKVRLNPKQSLFKTPLVTKLTRRKRGLRTDIELPKLMTPSSPIMDLLTKMAPGLSCKKIRIRVLSAICEVIPTLPMVGPAARILNTTILLTSFRRHKRSFTWRK